MVVSSSSNVFVVAVVEETAMVVMVKIQQISSCKLVIYSNYRASILCVRVKEVISREKSQQRQLSFVL
ncbi:hypothetical protein EmuJ_000888700 [Echinococcus multilocularis]|uniref:Uncharacterized protein n=1 Tax=Echinococcus multilocularis TaxID=6211 RepID=A0A068Y9M3_ECHMU|nr:hypothetical protein EmuJ_000888700 [Echinococcus multilocularis]